jgi:hypothetical protein
MGLYRMNIAYLSALAVLAGSIIGGVTSLAASWISQNSQIRAQYYVQEKVHREDLYKAFIEEASRLYGDALLNSEPKVANLVGLYAMVSRMRVMSSPAVVQNAEKVAREIVDTYFGPNTTLRELHEHMKSEGLDPLRNFSEACREDLTSYRSF